MKKTSLILLILIVGLFILSACSKDQATGYASYNPQQQDQAVGGGCGVSPQIPYEDTPVEDLQTNNLAI